MRLDTLETGRKVRVVSINKGTGAEQRLLEMGIVPGVEVELLAKHPLKGPVIVKLNNTRIALGRQLANSIEVE
ncbi:MAG: ferrous iron transport protein A [Syntrophomonadaceae bacterium]|nr:ferrous iron transport protein A [Syntrophomonadaceae bacterium]